MRLRQLFEEKIKEVAVIFGRFNPPHKGHALAWTTASNIDPWYVGTNEDTLGPKDPLPFRVKVEAMTTIFPEVQDHLIPTTSWLTLASYVYEKHGKINLVCVTDEAWVVPTIQDYNGKPGPHGFYEFPVIRLYHDSIEEAKSALRISSATSLRDAVAQGDREKFSDAAGVSSETIVMGKPFFDLVAEYLAPHQEKAKAKAQKTKAKTDKTKKEKESKKEKEPKEKGALDLETLRAAAKTAKPVNQGVAEAFGMYGTDAGYSGDGGVAEDAEPIDREFALVKKLGRLGQRIVQNPKLWDKYSDAIDNDDVDWIISLIQEGTGADKDEIMNLSDLFGEIGGGLGRIIDFAWAVKEGTWEEDFMNPYRQHRSQDVAEAFGPLPRKKQQIRLGRHTVDIERVGLDKNYIGFAWHDSQGQEHYEEVPVGDLGSYDDLKAKIKQEIKYQERNIAGQDMAEGRYGRSYSYNPDRDAEREWDAYKSGEQDFRNRERNAGIEHEDDPNFEREFRQQQIDRDRGPWYLKINGKILKKDGQPKVFDWKKGANNYGLAIVKNRPELQGKIFLTKKAEDDNG